MIQRALPAALFLVATGGVNMAGADDLTGLAPGARVKIMAPEHVEVPGLIDVFGTTVRSAGHFERRGDLLVNTDDCTTTAVPWPRATIVGDYQGATADAIALRLKNEDAVVLIPRPAIAQMEVRTRKGSRLLLGFAGALTGFMVGRQALSCHEIVCIPGAGGVVLALPGALLGAWAGGALERWELVQAGNVRVSMVPPPLARATGVAVALQF
jgi:hypothetical protein